MFMLIFYIPIVLVAISSFFAKRRSDEKWTRESSLIPPESIHTISYLSARLDCASRSLRLSLMRIVLFHTHTHTGAHGHCVVHFAARFVNVCAVLVVFVVASSRVVSGSLLGDLFCAGRPLVNCFVAFVRRS